RSMYTFNPTHTQGRNLAQTGSILSNRPAIGAWITYGLGSENENLPGFIVLSPGGGGGVSRSGFLPAQYQGTPFNTSEEEPEKMIRELRNKQPDETRQRRQLDLIQELNRN